MIHLKYSESLCRFPTVLLYGELNKGIHIYAKQPKKHSTHINSLATQDYSILSQTPLLKTGNLPVVVFAEADLVATNDQKNLNEILEDF